MHKISMGRKAFLVVNYVLLFSAALLCILPLINVLAISFSSKAAAAGGFVKLWPVEFTLASYQYALSKPEFLGGFLVSLERVALGFTVNILLTILCAYPLSKEKSAFRFRHIYAWFFIVTMLFNGGLIPTYITIKETGLLDSIWSLVLPGAVPVFNVILLMNFFRNLPKEIEEASLIDGAGHWRILWQIFLPLSLPAIATVSLFTLVHHWNSWFDGLIYMNSPDNYPLQSYLQTVIITPDLNAISGNELANMNEVSDRTFKAAQVFLASLPVLAVYPFLQKFFMKGLVMGSVKG
ncbi:carbohydrate ABC transporter permease [Paenibacillus sp. TRM 82003]|nr:carbohydrate ABC transporter permease [Paenibacillus sp. TRM 82003]